MENSFGTIHSKIGARNYVFANTFVGIKSLLNAASITAAHIRVNYKVNAAEGVNAASEEVSTTELVSTAYVGFKRLQDDS
ncbi:hypothetical protein Tco_0774970 [Tanacetum coccineum]|uniref:Uncharacterized protein n=1 Tax=Tanacetum coccineum TaxID=301880 RepID=A0ABQ4ZQ08_9ASTR